MLLIMLVLIVSCAWLFFRYRQEKAKKHHHKTKPLHELHPYHCVTIETAEHCCKAVEKLLDKRFLSVDAPQLPLHNCQISNCQCHYQHYDDRRDEHAGRRNNFGLGHDLFDTENQFNRRESKTGRRSSDKLS